MTEPLEFPPFVPAKPKGGVAKEIAALKGGEVAPIAETVEAPKRKRRTAAELEAAGVPKKKKRKSRAGTIPLDALPALAGLHANEAEQVVAFCEALQTYVPAARRRIVEALSKIFE